MAQPLFIDGSWTLSWASACTPSGISMDCLAGTCLVPSPFHSLPCTPVHLSIPEWKPQHRLYLFSPCSWPHVPYSGWFILLFLLASRYHSADNTTHVGDFNSLFSRPLLPWLCLYLVILLLPALYSALVSWHSRLSYTYPYKPNTMSVFSIHLTSHTGLYA